MRRQWHSLVMFFTLTSTTWNNTSFPSETMQYVTSALQDRTQFVTGVPSVWSLQAVASCSSLATSFCPYRRAQGCSLHQKMNNMFCDTSDVNMWHCQITLSTCFLNSLAAFVSSWHSSWLILNNQSWTWLLKNFFTEFANRDLLKHKPFWRLIVF